MNNKFSHKITVPRIIVIGFAAVSIISSVLLSFPAAAADGVRTHYADALFAAVSAVCVTGLSTVNTARHWSAFGHAVILVTGQIGALGFMTFVTLILTAAGKRVTLKERLVLRQMFNHKDMSDIMSLIKKAVAGTFILEAAGALIMTPAFMRGENVGFAKGLWYGLFHSICSFCSAGFDILGEGSLQRYSNVPSVNLTMVFLVTLGGLGYAVWIDVLSKNKKLSLHSRVVLEVTIGLTLFGTVFFLLAESFGSGAFAGMGAGERAMASLFQSVTPRTLGYVTVDQHNLSNGSQLLTLLFMFVGGSPGSTCGGVKTVTLVVIFASVFSVLQNKEHIVLHKREIAVITLQKALAVAGLYVIIVTAASIILSFTETESLRAFSLFDIVYETFSATGTVGLTLGITPYLTTGGKIIIMACMLLGRIGGVTAVLSLPHKIISESAVRHPEGNIIIG
ncbi:MAG: Trk family potassium uptake protein [Defluviitaleaceae bacterium]|nr:Trk family potassium uptake protein [Defluviitaleaceae bacterium]